MAPCPGCGIDEDAINVTDAIAAIRSFPRRYREALDAVPPDRLDTRPDPDTWSVLEYAAHAREVLEILAMLLPDVLDHPGVALPPEGVDPGGPPAEFPDALRDPVFVLGGIDRACDALAARADVTPVAAWDRTFTIGDDTRPASWIVAHAAHEGGHHLRDIARVSQRLGVGGDD